MFGSRVWTLLLAFPVLAELAVTPQFKWAQTVYNVYIVVTVKDLDASSIAVELKGVDHLKFAATGGDGSSDFALELPLREDVRDLPNMTSWEVAARQNRFGSQVVISLTKLNMHRWDRLLMDPKLHRKNMEKDWTRENATMESSEEFPYQEAYPQFLHDVSEKNFNETIARSRPLLLNVKYPWCHACHKLDSVFLAVAKDFKARSKKQPAYGNVTFGVLDAREHRVLARHFGAGLAPKCGVCEVKVLTEVGEEAEYIQNIEDVDDLADMVPLFMAPPVELLESLNSPSMEALKAANVTCVGSFVSETSSKYRLFKNISRTLRGELKFAAVFGADGAIEMWHPGSKNAERYEGPWENNGQGLLAWVRSRSLPLMQVYGWWLRKKYDSLALPIAKFFVDTEVDPKGSFLNDQARSVVKRLAVEYRGEVAFVEAPRQTMSHEMHDFMLDHPEVYPALGIQSNNSGNAHKHGFQLTGEVAPSVESFWKNEAAAFAKLSSFLRNVLDGKLAGAHESELPQINWAPGKLRRLCWRDYSEISSPSQPLLLELFHRYRVDSGEKEVSASHLSEVLSPYASNFTVARYDTGLNHFLPEHFKKRSKKDTESEWYWISANESAEAQGRPIMRRLMNPSIDASPLDVLAFVKRRSGLQIDIDELSSQHDKRMRKWRKFKKFSKLNELGPDESGKFPKGINLLVQVVEVEEVTRTPDGKDMDMCTGIVGDATGTMKMRFVGPKELPFAEPGKTIEVRNSKIALVNGTMHLAVGEWGLISPHDGEVEMVPNTEDSFSLEVYRDKKGRPRDEL